MSNIQTYFDIEYGNHDINSKENLEEGTTMIISSQGVDNGCYGFFSVEKKFQKPVISVPRTGSIGEAFVQQHPCNIDDNCLVLIPKKNVSVEYLFYVAEMIRRQKWRYMYGRQITPKRIEKLEVIEPKKFQLRIKYNKFKKRLEPKKITPKKQNLKSPQVKKFSITKIFDLRRGDFHAIDRLDEGKIPTISRVTTDNGLVGFYQKPDGATIFEPMFLTVSTLTGDTFLQLSRFIATDNVIILIPKKKLKLTTLLYIQSVMNRGIWKYSYGRQPYKRILEKRILVLPTQKGEIDEKYMEKIVTNQIFWKAIKKTVNNNVSK